MKSIITKDIIRSGTYYQECIIKTHYQEKIIEKILSRKYYQESIIKKALSRKYYRESIIKESIILNALPLKKHRYIDNDKIFE